METAPQPLGYGNVGHALAIAAITVVMLVLLSLLGAAKLLGLL